MKGYAYYNGQIGKCDDIKIPLSDRIIFFGDGVYDVMIGHGGKLFMPEEHLDRLYSNMKYLHINILLTKKHFFDLINDLINLSGYESYSIYISVSRNHNERCHSYRPSASTNLLIMINEFSLSSRDGLYLITEKDRRYYYCNIKTTNLLPAVLASTKAEDSGCDEAIFHRGNTITECAHSNIFILKNEELVTHPKSELILPGITRGLLIDIAKANHINVCERPFSLKDLSDADEVIITSTTKLIKSAKCINGKIVKSSGKHLVSALQDDAYKKYASI